MDIVRQLVLQLSVPAQLWTPAGEVVVTNATFNTLFGFPPDMRWAEEGRSLLADPQLSAATGDLLRKSLDGTPVEIAALPYAPIRKDAGDDAGALHLNMRLRPLWNDDGSVAGVLCTVTDYAVVDERMEHDLMRSQKMENVETLASGVAHEFNNIFTGIRGLTDLINDTVPKDSEIAELAKLIDKNITRGADLIDKLSSFAREMPHSLRRSSMAAYLRRALPLLQLQAPRRMDIGVDVRTDGDVLIDASRLDQALANLINNAKDATDGTGAICLTLGRGRPENTAGEEDWLLLEVADSGAGIPPELRERVVEPFFSTKERGRATGLGLSMTRRIVALHDGVMEVGQSAELGGAAIRIYLPLAQ